MPKVCWWIEVRSSEMRLRCKAAEDRALVNVDQSHIRTFTLLTQAHDKLGMLSLHLR
jgi:hypothetical protein